MTTIIGGFIVLVLSGVLLLAWIRWINFNDKQRSMLRTTEPDNPLIAEHATKILTHWIGWQIFRVLWLIGWVVLAVTAWISLT